jgi:pyridinium-3,5-bisthiocarboxylic acid mononucleotide nickel chelatase
MALERPTKPRRSIDCHKPMDKLIWIDASAGIAGDMFVGALLDAGGSFEALQKGLSTLNINEYTISCRKLKRAGLAATKFSVNDTSPEPGDRHGTHLSQILSLIEGSRISETAKHRASCVFRALGEAEAKAHGIDIEKVHFHEVGAIDAIVDIVGACILLGDLGIKEIVGSAIPAGRGTVKCAHGILTVPTPAVVSLCMDWPMIQDGRDGELSTPTGVALLTTLGTHGDMPSITPFATGMGAGSRDTPDRANVTRVIIGTPSKSLSDTANRVWVVETQLDDCPPELIPSLYNKLFSAGAVDVYTTAITMKKGRPGILLTALTTKPNTEAISDTILRHSTAFGVRMYETGRTVLSRHHITVQTQYGECRVKIGSLDGEVVQSAPELVDCQSLAEAAGVPISAVRQSALNAIKDY